MSYKRDLVLKTFNNEETDRAPIGFWYHFAKDETVPRTDELVKINYNGHLKFCKDVEPDFLKIMSDGFFHYPGVASEPVTCAADLKKIKSGKSETLAWIDRQIDMVKKVASQYGKDMVTLYNVFSPASYLTFATENLSFKNITSFYEEDPEALKNALLTIAEDVKILADRAIREAGVDGIYFSVGCYDGISREEYQRIIEPSELAVLEVANAANDCNMIHICGYAGRKTDLTTFKDYPVKAVNWATVVEGIPLEEGQMECFILEPKSRLRLRPREFSVQRAPEALFWALTAPFRVERRLPIFSGSVRLLRNLEKADRIAIRTVNGSRVIAFVKLTSAVPLFLFITPNYLLIK